MRSLLSQLVSHSACRVLFARVRESCRRPFRRSLDLRLLLLCCFRHSVISLFQIVRVHLYRAGSKERTSRLSLLYSFLRGPFVSPKLLCVEGLSTGAASPLSQWFQRVSSARVGRAAGSERHHQFTTTLQAQSHVNVVYTNRSRAVWSQLLSLRGPP